MGIVTALCLVIVVLGLALVYQVHRYEKLENETEETSVDDWRTIEGLTRENYNIKEAYDLMHQQIEKQNGALAKAVQQRADAWQLLGQVVEENIRDRKVPAEIKTEIGREGVYYVFSYDPEPGYISPKEKVNTG